MTPTHVLPFPDLQHAKYCGGCPQCGRNDGFVNLGTEHWFICREHKTKWPGGTNMFDGWINQTVAQTMSVEVLLRAYTEVIPHHGQAENKREAMQGRVGNLF